MKSSPKLPEENFQYFSENLSKILINHCEKYLKKIFWKITRSLRSCVTWENRRQLRQSNYYYVMIVSIYRKNFWQFRKRSHFLKSHSEKSAWSKMQFSEEIRTKYCWDFVCWEERDFRWKLSNIFLNFLVSRALSLFWKLLILFCLLCKNDLKIVFRMRVSRFFHNRKQCSLDYIAKSRQTFDRWKNIDSQIIEISIAKISTQQNTDLFAQLHYSFFAHLVFYRID